MTDSECHFTVDLYAPKGLRGIEDTISACELPLYAWTSGDNGKVILRARQNDTLDWNMETSDDAFMFISGNISGSVESSARKLNSLSACLKNAGIPHCIYLDDPDGNLHTKIEHAWPRR